MKRYKLMIASEEEGNQVQRKAMSMGCKWIGGGSCITTLICPYMYISPGLIKANSTTDYFRKSSAECISVKEFLDLPDERIFNITPTEWVWVRIRHVLGWKLRNYSHNGERGFYTTDGNVWTEIALYVGNHDVFKDQEPSGIFTLEDIRNEF